MARLTDEDWQKLKADWCTGHYSNRDLGERFGVSNVAITKRAQKEGWVKLPSSVVANFVETRAQTLKAIKEVSAVSKIDPANLAKSLDKVAADKERFQEVGMNIMNKIDAMLDQVVQVSEVKDLALAHKALYEPRFKTAPDTAVQINNSNSIEPKSLADFYSDPHA